MNPNDKKTVQNIIGRQLDSGKTNAEYFMDNLTDEALRDVARNEAAERPWRKAAVKFLIARNHKFQFHQDFHDIRSEILEEKQAEAEVKAVVESVIEHPFSPESEPKYPEFSSESWADGYWEVYHDDDCGGVITPYPENLCLKCGMHPDFQSRGARKTGKSL